METFSVARAVPGMRPGARVRNTALVLVAPAIVFVWPFVAAYAVGTDRGGCASALAAVPGIARGGGKVAAGAAFAWTTLALVVLFAPLSVVAPTVVGYWVALVLPGLYLLGIGFAAGQTVTLFRAWMALGESSEVRFGPVQLSGAAGVAEATIETPFSGTDAVAHVSARYQYTHSVDPGTLDESTWSLRDRESAAVPFTVESEGGPVLVDATASAVTLEATRSTVSGDETATVTAPLPDDIPDTPDPTVGSEDAGPTGYAEQRIEPGDTVTVSGIAVPPTDVDRVDGTYRAVVTDTERAPADHDGAVATPFVVTDEASNAARTVLLRRWAGSLALTALLTVPLAFSPLPGRLLAFFGL